MMRICILIVVALFALTRSVSAESTNWPPAVYAEVRAYLYNLAGEQAAPIVKQGKLDATVWNPEGAALNKKQMATVQKAVVDYHPAGLRPPSADCYQPRHAFIYYDAEHKPVGFVEICFSCRNYRTSPEHPGEVDLDTLKKVFVELKIPVFDKDEAYLSLKKRKTK